MIHLNFHARFAVLAAALTWAAAAPGQTLTSLTANNTAACPASGTLPAQCQLTYTGQTDPRQYVATPEFDRPAGNVSDEDIHGYLDKGASTKIYANFMLPYCTSPLTQENGINYCNNNVVPGYTSNTAATVEAQASDLRNRHIDGAIMTWEGDGTSEDAATLKFQSYVNSKYCSGPQQCDPMYFIMYDGPSWQYTVTSTGIPGTSGAGCTGLTGSTFENCVVAHIRNDMCYMNGYHWGNNAYQKANGRPIVQDFPDETVIPATGAAPSWADVWVQIEDWNNALTTNCNKAPYNADNGVPLIVFQGTPGYTHEDTSGSFYWVQPAGTDPQTDQFLYNIAPQSQAGTLDNFLETSLSYPNDYTWSNGFKGFNSEQANWGTGRIMDQLCGQTWINSLTASNGYYSSNALPYLQIATWNDYNEGTEIESGIDNCFTASGVISGTSLKWYLNPTNSSAASLSTVSHVEIYDSPDGQNLTLLTSFVPTAENGAYSLSGLAAGKHQLFVRMLGKNSILNRISSPIVYNN